MFGLLIFFGIIAGLIYLFKKFPEILLSTTRLPYEKRDALFSPAEKLFLTALEKAIGNQYEIFGKVRMADIMDVKKNLNGKDYQIAWNGISSKHIDFVLCDATDSAFVCGIELDDKSHNQANRAKRDVFVNKAFEAISLPLIRFEVKAGYDVGKVRNTILQELGVLKPEEPIAPAEATPPRKENEHICPKCSGPMTRRKANVGENVGKTFWVCNDYKSCKTAILDESLRTNSTQDNS